jgi:hypothetical protein
MPEMTGLRDTKEAGSDRVGLNSIDGGHHVSVSIGAQNSFISEKCPLYQRLFVRCSSALCNIGAVVKLVPNL